MQAETSYPAIVGRIIEYLRKEKGLKQETVATKLKLKQATWSRIERGQSGISLEQLSNVSDLLGTTPHQIIKNADYAKDALSNQGIKVHPQIIAKPSNNMALIGLIALSAMILTAILKK